MYVIAGVSGRTGGAAARGLLAAGVKVRAIVRDTDKGADWARRGVEIAVGTLRDPEFLARAFTGATGAYALLPGDPSFDDPAAAVREYADALADAAAKSGLSHLALLSSLAAGRGGGGALDALGAAEESLREAVPRLTLLRPAFFLENWLPSRAAAASGLLPAYFSPDRPLAMVSAHDVGVLAAEALLDPPEGEEVLSLAGPRDYTARDVAAEMAKLLGRRVEVLPVAKAARAAMLSRGGFAPSEAEALVALYDDVEEGRLDPLPGAPLYRCATTLGEVLRAG
jgi:uncharacterized protein YbjT (DUF2867 family)